MTFPASIFKLSQSMDQSFRSVGAQYHNGSASFAVWAPLKKNVELVIRENKEHFISMHLDEFGYWNITVDALKPGTAYWLNIDNEIILPDPASRSQPLGIRGPSVVFDSSFEWTDQPWSGIPLKDMVIYELHVGTFSPSGTFDGVIERLSYLKELGVNAIELMPVAQFPGSRNWGNDGVYPFAVQNTYGGPGGLKNLVNQAHQHGIAIILDVVYNHLGPEGNYFMNYAPYFTDKYKTFWIEKVREGRKEECSYFKWEGEVPDPQSEETFLKCKLSWSYNNDKYQWKLHELYTFLISFRKQRVAYRGKDLDSGYVYDPGFGKVIAFEKSYETDRILIILNSNKSTAPFRLTSKAPPPSQKIFDSSALKWLGPGEITFSEFNSNNEILLHPESFVIFEF